MPFWPLSLSLMCPAEWQHVFSQDHIELYIMHSFPHLSVLSMQQVLAYIESEEQGENDPLWTTEQLFSGLLS